MSFRSAFILTGALALIGFGAAHAEDSAMKQCADKWQAAKTAGTTGGLTYLQFSSKCRAELKAQPAAAPAPAAPAPAPAPTTAAAPKPAPAPAPAAPAAAGAAVFPTAVSPAYKDLTRGKAIMKTCVDQYNANKATNANGGLKWIQKGGGYYSECNKKLKG
jgi:pyruvate/2-oxoglutarate dehydrogenase complex dihydrolipoamide acyltransferase (E2) component